MHATKVKRFTLSFCSEPTSPFMIVTQAALKGSFTMRVFPRAPVNVQPIPTPRRTGDTNKKKQRSEFHIHIAKLVYLDTHNQAVVTLD